MSVSTTVERGWLAEKSSDDGSMRNDHRQESLAKIRDDPKTRVILISFKAGSTGVSPPFNGVAKVLTVTIRS